MSKTELVMFDLGNVLLNFDFKKVIRGLAKHSKKSSAEIRQYFQQTPLWDKFERGHVSPKDFFKDLTAELGVSGLNFEEFLPLLNEIFEANQETVAIVEQLRKRYRLAMISNVNQLHWEYVRDQHPFMHWFEIPIASFAVGHRKPEPEIFHVTLKRAGVRPEHSIFIDDIHAHILAAQAIGIRGHQFLTAKQLRKDLQGVLD